MINRKQAGIAFVLVVLALVVVFVLRARELATPVGPAEGATASDSAPSDTETPAIQASERAVVDAGQALIAPATGTPILGRVIDLAGAPIGGVTIEQRINTRRAPVAVSGDDGSFETRIERFEGALTTSDGPWECVAPCKLDRGRAKESHVLVVARAIAVRGRVVDERGRGVCEAAIGVRVTVDVKQTLPASFSTAPDILGAATSDATGHFELPRIASVPGSRLLASRDPLEAVGQLLTLDDQPLLIVLGNPEDGRLIEILVVDVAQQPIEGATIEFGRHHGKTALDGVCRFVLYERDSRPEEGAVAALTVCEVGYQPARIENFGSLAFDGKRAPITRSIVLVAPELSISGRIVDARGNPCRVVSVRVAAPAGAPHERSTCADGYEGVRGVDTFELRGLRHGEYVLECTVQQPLASFLSEPIRAGASDVVVRMPSDLLAPRVVGRVYSLAGSVVPNAKVGVLIREVTNAEIPDPEQYFKHVLEQVSCDAGGVFELIDLPRSGAQLVVWHPSFAPTVLNLGDLDLTRELNVVVRGRSKLCVVGLPPKLTQLRVRLVDAAGQVPWLRGLKAGSTAGECLLAIRNGVSETVEVAEGRYTLSADNPAGLFEPREIELVAERTTIVTP